MRKGDGVYNLVVIGAGTAGLVTAAGSIALGARVALVERNKMGGDCLNFGCVPSKALISSARLLQRMRTADAWGIKQTEAEFDFAKVFASMRAQRATLAPLDSQERFESLGVDVFREEAVFLSPRELQVGDHILRARHFVIATGSRAAIPAPIRQSRVPYYTNETVFDELKEKPESLLIVGGGPIGCELGQMFSRLGVKVTILQRGKRLLDKEDPVVSKFVRTILEAEGVRVLTEAEIEEAQSSGAGVTLRCQSETVSGTALLVAAGRRPNVENLDLQKANVAFTKKGVTVDEHLQTTQPGIYALGDVIGQLQFTHVADYHARVVIRNTLVPLSFLRQKIDYSAVPWCTYLDPEVATVGLTESKAKADGIAYDLIEQEMKEVDRAVLERAPAGFARVLVRRGSDEVIGATIVGEHAGELIREFVLAMKHGIGLKQIAATVYSYPTFASLVLKTAEKLNKQRLTPLARKITGWLYDRGPMKKWLQNYWRWIALVFGLLALSLALSFLPLAVWVKSFVDWVRDLGFAGVLIFIGIYGASAVLLFPAVLLTIAAGLIYGIAAGTAVALAGATLGAGLAFLVARYLLRSRIKKLAQRNKKFGLIDDAIGKQGWKIVGLLRLSPLIPFNVSNYFYGLTSIRFWPYLLASVVGMFPGTLLYAYLGAIGKAGLSVGKEGRSPLEWTFLGIGLLATIAVTFFVSRLAKNALEKTAAAK